MLLYRVIDTSTMLSVHQRYKAEPVEAGYTMILDTSTLLCNGSVSTKMQNFKY